MRRRVVRFTTWTVLILGGLLFAFCAVIREVRVDGEKHVRTAYIQFRCSTGREPTSEQDLLGKAIGSYGRTLRGEARMFGMSVVHGAVSNRGLALRFKGWYFGPFDDTIEMNEGEVDCSHADSDRLYFPTNAQPLK